MSIRPYPAHWTRADWLEHRRHGLGASDVAAIAGMSTYASPMSVYLDKTGQLPLDDDMPEYMRWGLLLEPAVRAEFTERTGLSVVMPQAIAERDEEPWQRATLDGLVLDGEHDADVVEHLELVDCALGVLEQKTTRDSSWDEALPDHVALQVQWQLGVAGYPRAWLAVLHGGQRLQIHEIDADPATFDALTTLARRFWHDHVLAGRPPAADSNDATTTALKAAFVETDGAAVELDADVAGYARRWLAAKQEAKAANARVDLIENSLRAALGEHETGLVDGVPVVTWKSQQSKRIDAKALRDHAPEIADQFTTVSTSRVLRAVEKNLKETA